jgi:hypothetical protein
MERYTLWIAILEMPSLKSVLSQWHSALLILCTNKRFTLVKINVTALSQLIDLFHKYSAYAKLKKKAGIHVFFIM